MSDREIVELYFQRSEEAIAATDAQYGSYCYAIAYRVLSSAQDSEECVSDTYLTAWNRIPPTRPNHLGVFLGRITRNLSIDRWRRDHAEKRGGGQLRLAVEELDRSLAGGEEPEEILLRGELTAALSAFLKTLPEPERQVFVCRYWYLDPIGEIARRFGFTQSKVKSMLLRTRGKLRRYLEEGNWA